MDWPAVARLRGTVVLLMAIDNLPAIVASLLDNGRRPETPVAVVQDGSLGTERRTFATLATVAGVVAEQGFRPPAVVVMGDVVTVARDVRSPPSMG